MANEQETQDLPYEPEEDQRPPAPAPSEGEGDSGEGAFGKPPGSLDYITIGGEGSTRWHRWDSDAQKQVPIEGEAILGRVDKVEMFTREYDDDKYGTADKTNIHLDTRDGTYVLQAGASTVFMRYAMAALLSEDADLSEPLWFAPKNGDDDKVMLAEVRTEEGDLTNVDEDGLKNEPSDDPAEDVQAVADEIGQEDDPLSGLNS